MIETERLLLRPWRADDVDWFAAMSADPEVMRHLNGVVDRDTAAAVINRQQALIDEHGHGFWAVVRKEDAAPIGFCGVRIGGHPGTPVEHELEIGWRLRRGAWGRGYAREAAEASMAWGWANLTYSRIAAWTVPANIASWGLMLRLGMTSRSDMDFDHPLFAEGHPLRRHLVYAIDRPQ